MLNLWDQSYQKGLVSVSNIQHTTLKHTQAFSYLVKRKYHTMSLLLCPVCLYAKCMFMAHNSKS